MPSAIFYGTLVPVVAYVVVRKLLVDPYLRQREADESKRKQLKLKSELSEKRRLALVAVSNRVILSLLFSMFLPKPKKQDVFFYTL